MSHRSISKGPFRRLCFALIFECILVCLPLTADEPSARRGYEFLTSNALVPPDFPEAIFDEVWTMWPEPLRSEAEKATPEERRKLAFTRYGLTPRPV